jgi:hypothetical protein
MYREGGGRKDSSSYSREWILLHLHWETEENQNATGPSYFSHKLGDSDARETAQWTLESSMCSWMHAGLTTSLPVFAATSKQHSSANRTLMRQVYKATLALSPSVDRSGESETVLSSAATLQAPDAS